MFAFSTSSFVDDGWGERHWSPTGACLVLQSHFSLGPSVNESPRFSGVSRSKGTPTGNEMKCKHTRRKDWKEMLGQKNSCSSPPSLFPKLSLGFPSFSQPALSLWAPAPLTQIQGERNPFFLFPFSTAEIGSDFQKELYLKKHHHRKYKGRVKKKTTKKI